MTTKTRNIFRLEIKVVNQGPPYWFRYKSFATKKEALDAGDALVEQNAKYAEARVRTERWPAVLTCSPSANQVIKALLVACAAQDDDEFTKALDAEFMASPRLWAEFRERAIPLLERSLERLKKNVEFTS